MKIFPLETGNFKIDGGPMFGVIPKMMWQKVYPCDENNLCNWAMRCMLIIDNNRKILIDNGIGDKLDEKWLNYYYLNGNDTLEKSLADIGESPETITDVIITHMHFDHCGGNVKWNNDKTGYRLAFPNAVHWLSREQYDWAANPKRQNKVSFYKENIFPVFESGKLNLIEEQGEFIPNITFKLFDGHTKGQIIPHINFNGKTIVFMADLLPSVVHIPMPWIMAYDTRPLITLKEKELFLSEALENDYILFFEHDLYNEACTLQDTSKGIRALKSGKLSDFI